LVGSPHVLDTVVCQVVPSPKNPYVLRFGEGAYRDWVSPNAALVIIKTWRQLRWEVVIHPHRSGVRSVGESRGLARFVLGGGVSVFVAREVGALPDGAEFNGLSLGGMIVTFGIELPNPGARPATYHVFPAEYLADPELPGLAPGLSRSQLLYQLPHPPVFHQSSTFVDGSPGLFHSFVVVSASSQEWDEGAVSLFSQLMRGPSYRRLRGLPHT
jgi:hypothetical protein